MQRRSFLGLTLATACSPVCSLSATDEFWATRSPEQWSGQEIKQIATSSPWAKTVNVHLPANTLPSSVSGPPGGGGYQDPRATQQDDNEASGVMSHVLVRWDSALPVSEACSRGSNTDKDLFSCASKLFSLSVLGRKFEEMRQDFYILSLTNYPITQRGKDAIQHSDTGNAALERMCRQMQQTTYLKPKSRPAFRPDHIVALPWDQALLLLVFFPRTEDLSLDDREVAFQSINGIVELKATFDLQKMRFQGKLSL
jgi:hypothetical protein